MVACWLRRLVVIAMFGWLFGCDYAAQKELKVGESTRDDVVRYMGKPEMIWEENDGSQVMEYARGPQGHQTYMVEIGADGKYRGMKNILIDDTFARVKPGMSRDDVRRLLGKPTETVEFKLKHEIVWSWRHHGDQQRPRMFNVHFDPSGRVKNTSHSEDPKLVNG